MERNRSRATSGRAEIRPRRFSAALALGVACLWGASQVPRVGAQEPPPAPRLTEGASSPQQTSLPGLSTGGQRQPGLPGLGATATAARFTTDAARIGYIVYHGRRARELLSQDMRRKIGLSPEAAAEVDRMRSTIEGIAAEVQSRDVAKIKASLDRYEATSRLLDARLSPLLTEVQVTRLLAELTSQQRGVVVFLYPEVVRRLNLSQDQQSRIEAIAMADLQALESFRPSQIPALIRQAGESRNRVESLLSPSQRQAWQRVQRGEAIGNVTAP